MCRTPILRKMSDRFLGDGRLAVPKCGVSAFDELDGKRKPFLEKQSTDKNENPTESSRIVFVTHHVSAGIFIVGVPQA